MRSRFNRLFFLISALLFMSASLFGQSLKPQKDYGNFKEFHFKSIEFHPVVISLPSNTAIFVNDEPAYFFVKDTVIHYGFENFKVQDYVGLVRIGFFKPSGLSGLEVALEAEPPEPHQLSLSERYDLKLDDFLVIAILALLALYALYLNAFPLTFMGYLSPFGSPANKDLNLLKSNPFSKENALLIVFHSVAIATLFFTSLSVLRPEMIQGLNDESIIFYFLLSALLIVLFFFLKYILLVYLGSILEKNDIPPLHFLEYLKLSFWYVNSGLIFMLYLVLSGQQFWLTSQFLVGIVIFLGLFRTAWLLIRLAVSGSFSYLNLFSYLCASEILPLFVGVKIALNW